MLSGPSLWRQPFGVRMRLCVLHAVRARQIRLGVKSGMSLWGGPQWAGTDVDASWPLFSACQTYAYLASEVPCELSPPSFCRWGT